MSILTIDQGTTGTTTMIVGKTGQIIAKAYREFGQIYPKPGWVEHDPMAIWQTVVDTVEEVCAGFEGKIFGVGITNQRETTIVWDRKTGQPVYNAIVWQCRRTEDLCQGLATSAGFIQDRTGLKLDAYYSATKVRWILDAVKPDRLDDLVFGTIDTWLIYKFTNGQVHATDYTNASRTLLFSIEKKAWDPELMELFGVPESMLAQIKTSMDFYGEVSAIPALKGVPILGVAGDQQAALFGQTCFSDGQIKNTYGTGSFMVINTGDCLVRSQNGLSSTVAVGANGDPCYALEGSMFIAGAAIQWLRDELQIIESAADSEALALSIPDNEGVVMVPAFVGLGAPHWDMSARAAIFGMTRGTNRAHFVRAAIEAMAYQSYDVLKVMQQETGAVIKELYIDGGAVANEFLCQFQADILGIPVVRPKIIESTGIGVAYLAGLKSGVWRTAEDLKNLKGIDKKFIPNLDTNLRKEWINLWQRALSACQSF